MAKDESMEYRFDALNTAIQRLARLQKANVFFRDNHKDAPADIFNTISAVLYTEIIDAQKQIVFCATYYIAAVKKEDEEIREP